MNNQHKSQYVTKNEYNTISEGELFREWAESGILKDGDQSKSVILERYFHDLYNIFLKKLTGVATGEVRDEYEQRRMKMILDELLKVRVLMEQEKGNNIDM